MNRATSSWLLTSAPSAPAAGAESQVDRWARRAAHRLLSGIRRGELILEEGSARHAFGSPHFGDSLRVHVRVENPKMYRRLLCGGSMGAAEAYMEGGWTCDNLTNLIRLSLRNRAELAPLDYRWTRVLAPAYALYDRLRRNTPAGSRRNIAEHYDLGNDFFQAFLDPTMMYSCAVFEDPAWDLGRAQIEKLDRICRKLRLTPRDRVLEIGSGWGGFALYAARHYGCHVTTTTISRQQYEWAERRIREEGLEDHIDLLFEDYRELKGRYDRVVSIEMLEAVGHEYYPAYFRALSERLRPGGEALLQTITIADQEYDRAKDEVDFIRRYIFPGGCLPSVTALADVMTRETPLRISGLEDLTPHYALTLAHWRRNFFDRLDEIRRLGYSEEFIRRWEYYLCYCEGGFAEKAIGLVQLQLFRPA